MDKLQPMSKTELKDVTRAFCHDIANEISQLIEKAPEGIWDCAEIRYLIRRKAKELVWGCYETNPKYKKRYKELEKWLGY